MDGAPPKKLPTFDAETLCESIDNVNQLAFEENRLPPVSDELRSSILGACQDLPMTAPDMRRTFAEHSAALNELFGDLERRGLYGGMGGTEPSSTGTGTGTGLSDGGSGSTLDALDLEE